MKHIYLWGLSITLAFFSASTTEAQEEFEKNIMTGGPSGTYIQFGNDIAALGTSCGQTLNVNESAGSLENIIAVRDRRYTQFGIVQSDLLNYLKTYAADDAALQRITNDVVIAAPLYNEEIQIVAKSVLATLSDLEGKRVSVGVENSGTFLTSTQVLGLTGIVPGETMNMNATDSLAALLADEIDAFFYVAGAPTTLLAEADLSPTDYRILPLKDEALLENYAPTTLPAKTYSFQPNAVDVMSVKAVLMTFDYKPTLNSYHRLSCEAVSEFAHQIFTNFNELKETGHPKWQSVDLTAIPPGWKVGECVNQGLAPDYVSTCEPIAPVEAVAEPDANNLYRERICAVIGDCE